MRQGLTFSHKFARRGLKSATGRRRDQFKQAIIFINLALVTCAELEGKIRDGV